MKVLVTNRFLKDVSVGMEVIVREAVFLNAANKPSSVGWKEPLN